MDIEILQELVDDVTTNMIFEILAIKFLSEIEKYNAMATLVLIYVVVFERTISCRSETAKHSYFQQRSL